MFNMEKVGFKISELRKSNNMTQMELADKMNISFQAVSNWERGNSMPDISKLPELAQLFGVTIDEILGEKSELIDCAANDEVDKYIGDNTVTPEQLSNCAPILRPEQVETIFEKTQINTLHEAVDLVAFLRRDTVNQLVLKAAADCNYSNLAEIAPFVDKNVINEIAVKMINEGKNIADIVPFVSREIISELAELHYRKYGLYYFDDIAPFVPKEQLQKIAEEEYENRGLSHFELIAPFLNRGYLNDLAERAIKKEGIKAISPLAPFLDKDMLEKYVKEMLL